MAVWRHSGGGFTHKGNKLWVEDDGGLTELKFSEYSRDNQRREVVLYDQPRNLYVTLTPSQSLMKYGTTETVLFIGTWTPRSILLRDGSSVLCQFDPQWQMVKKPSMPNTLAGNVLNGIESSGWTVGQGSDSTVLVLAEVGGERRFQIDRSGRVNFSNSQSQDWQSLSIVTAEWTLPPRADTPLLRADIEPTVTRSGHPIAIVSLGTPNIASYSKLAEANHLAYAARHGYTVYEYHDTIIDWDESKNGVWHSIVTWNKIRAVMNHLSDHEWVIWIDSDAIVTDMDKPLTDIIDQAPNKHFLVCKDPKDWLLNTGVMFFHNSPWTHSMLQRLWAMPKTHHSSGAEQSQLIKLLEHIDRDRVSWELFPETAFNTHPTNHKDGMFVIHYMGMGTAYKVASLTKWLDKLGIPNPNIQKLEL